MSDDIVKELRESKIALHSTAHKAADEIDKLREELEAYDKTTKEHCDEITRLRADLAAERDRNRIITQAAQEVTNALRTNLAAVTAERDRMREALKDLIEEYEYQTCLGEEDGGIALAAARAAIEGVTEPASPKAETEFFVFDEFAPLPEPPR